MSKQSAADKKLAEAFSALETELAKSVKASKASREALNASVGRLREAVGKV